MHFPYWKQALSRQPQLDPGLWLCREFTLHFELRSPSRLICEKSCVKFHWLECLREEVIGEFHLGAKVGMPG
jgi:hypothetical protein